jgi:glyoxylase-like metal-dependent hydrolase (beta-lactamase superfamily II)
MEREMTIVEAPNGGWDPRVRLFRAGTEVDVFVVMTSRFVVFVDTTATPENAAAIVETMRPALATRLPLVIATHADYDHAWGNAAFAGPDAACHAPIVGHRSTYERLRGEHAREQLERMQRAEPRLTHVRLVPPTIVFEDGLRIDGGDLTLELLHTPGHTEDHVAVWIPEIRTLLAGDAAEQPFPAPRVPEDLPILRASLRRLQGLAPLVVLPCHGGTHDPGLLERNLAYFDHLQHTLAALLDAGPAPADWRTRQDLDLVVGLPFAEMPMALDAPPTTLDFYHDMHRLNLVATLAGMLGNYSGGAAP